MIHRCIAKLARRKNSHKNSQFLFSYHHSKYPHHTMQCVRHYILLSAANAKLDRHYGNGLYIIYDLFIPNHGFFFLKSKENHVYLFRISSIIKFRRLAFVKNIIEKFCSTFSIHVRRPV